MALAEKHALITGSSRGIGRGIALTLADSGLRSRSTTTGTNLPHEKPWRRCADEALMESWCRQM